MVSHSKPKVTGKVIVYSLVIGEILGYYCIHPPARNI